MSVMCRQSVDGVPGESFVIAPHSAKQTDAKLLSLKATGAEDKGWSVEWTGKQSFTATKERWGGKVCVREFWVE